MADPKEKSKPITDYRDFDIEEAISEGEAYHTHGVYEGPAGVQMAKFIIPRLIMEIRELRAKEA